MATEVRLPRLGQGMESGTIVRWLKAEGERVEKGEPLYEVDTDKATQEVEAEQSGVLLRIAVVSGEVPVGETVALIGEQGESTESLAPASTQSETPQAAPARSVAPETASPPAAGHNGGGAAASAEAPARRPPARPESRTDFRTAFSDARSGGRVKASPLARRMARDAGVDLHSLTGSGPDGRIIAEDVERAGSGLLGGAATPVPPAGGPPASPSPVAGQPSHVRAAYEQDAESIPLTGIRKTIARRLGEAWQLPAFQLTLSVEMTHADQLVARSRELNPEARVTVTDLLAKVCARALMRHRELNAQFGEDELLRFAAANIGIAVAAPQGLVVPVIASVERLSLVEVAVRRAELVARAREGRLRREDLEGGTFTISNLGMYGVEQFSAVLNAPQAAILAVGASLERPIARGGQVVVAPMMTITLTVDHRAVDGGPAAEFLQTVKAFLEDPALAL